MNLRPTSKPPGASTAAAGTEGDSLSAVQRVVGAWTYSYFLKDGSIEELKAASAEESLRELCKLKMKSRYWMLEEIETCLTDCPNAPHELPPTKTP